MSERNSCRNDERKLSERCLDPLTDVKDIGLSSRQNNRPKIRQKTLNLIVFEKSMVDEILGITKLNIKTAKCHACKKKLTKDNVCHIAKLKGKSRGFCDNPACFTLLLVEGGHIG